MTNFPFYTSCFSCYNKQMLLLQVETMKKKKYESFQSWPMEEINESKNTWLRAPSGCLIHFVEWMDTEKKQDMYKESLSLWCLLILSTLLWHCLGYRSLVRMEINWDQACRLPSSPIIRNDCLLHCPASYSIETSTLNDKWIPPNTNECQITEQVLEFQFHLCRTSPPPPS